jgi:hypothetical protein
MGKYVKSTCVCGYKGLFDEARVSASDGRAHIILMAFASNLEHWHRGSVDLLVCPICSTVKIKRN